MAFSPVRLNLCKLKTSLEWLRLAHANLIPFIDKALHHLSNLITLFILRLIYERKICQEILRCNYFQCEKIWGILVSYRKDAGAQRRRRGIYVFFMTQNF
jgi:hypothetical protein